MRTAHLITLAILWGCGSAPADCPDCPDCPTVPECDDCEQGADLSSFEEQVVGPVLEDLRAGVRPFADGTLGVCQSADGKTCDGPVDGEELPPGDYLFYAELRVPKQAPEEGWTVNFSTECTNTRVTENGESSSSHSSNKEYKVSYTGEERGYRLRLRTLKSPREGGRQECSWVLSSPHPDGDKVYEGQWIVPQGG